MPDGGSQITGLGVGDVLTVSAAARALGIREAEARAWLRGCDLVRHVAGRERVIWGDVLAAIRRGDEPPEKDAPRPRGATLPRARL